MIQSHAAGLKDIFCKTVDLAMNKNLEKVDQIEKTEIKQLDTYIDQVTTDKLSLVSRLIHYIRFFPNHAFLNHERVIGLLQFHTCDLSGF
jgi:hypothetical protein